MKKLLVLAAFAAMLVSCQKDNNPASEGVPMKLIADIGEITRVTYEPDGNVLKASWEASETISVVTLDGSGQLFCVDNFTSTGAAGRATAEFSGTFNGGDSPAKVIVIYPALTKNGAGKYESAPYYDHTGSERSFLYDGAEGSVYIQGANYTLKQTADNDASHLRNYCILSGVANKDDLKANTLNVTLSHEMIVIKVIATFPAAMKGKPLQSMMISSFDKTDAKKGWSRSNSWEYIDIPSEHIVGRGGGYNNIWNLYANNIVIPDSGIVSLYFVNYRLNDMEVGDKLVFTATVDDVDCTPATKTFTANTSFDKGKIYRVSVTIPE